MSDVKKRKEPFGRPSLCEGPTIDRIDCRVPARMKGSMVAEARRCGLNLSEWVRRTLLAEVEGQREKRRKKR